MKRGGRVAKGRSLPRGVLVMTLLVVYYLFACWDAAAAAKHTDFLLILDKATRETLD